MKSKVNKYIVRKAVAHGKVKSVQKIAECIGMDWQKLYRMVRGSQAFDRPTVESLIQYLQLDKSEQLEFMTMIYTHCTHSYDSQYSDFDGCIVRLMLLNNSFLAESAREGIVAKLTYDLDKIVLNTPNRDLN